MKKICLNMQVIYSLYWSNSLKVLKKTNNLWKGYKNNINKRLKSEKKKFCYKKQSKKVEMWIFRTKMKKNSTKKERKEVNKKKKGKLEKREEIIKKRNKEVKEMRKRIKQIKTGTNRINQKEEMKKRKRS